MPDPPYNPFYPPSLPGQPSPLRVPPIDMPKPTRAWNRLLRSSLVHAPNQLRASARHRRALTRLIAKRR